MYIFCFVQFSFFFMHFEYISLMALSSFLQNNNFEDAHHLYNDIFIKTTVNFLIICICSVIMLSVNVGITSAAPGMYKDHSGVAEILAAGIIIKMLDGGL